jgi:hypothetical protein
MIDGVSDKCAHYAELFQIAKNSSKLGFAGDHRQAKSPCNRCRNRRMLFEYETSEHIAKHKLMPNYLVWHQHWEVQAPAAAKSGRRDDEDRIDDMIADIHMEYDLGSGDQHPPPEVHNLYRFSTVVGGEPSHPHRGYLQRPPPLGFSDSQYTWSCRGYTHHVLQEAESVWGPYVEAKVNSWCGGSRHHAGEGQKPEVAC